jgi:dihydropteroate synthase
LGFQTTSELKAELARSQKDLSQLTAINKTLNATVDDITARNTKMVQVLENYQQAKAAVVETVAEVVEVRKEKARPIQAKLVSKTVTTATTFTQPIEEYNQLSEANIDAILTAFNAFQPSSP